MHTLLPAILALVLSLLAYGTPIFLTLRMEALGLPLTSTSLILYIQYGEALTVLPSRSTLNQSASLAPGHSSCGSLMSAFQLVLLISSSWQWGVDLMKQSVVPLLCRHQQWPKSRWCPSEPRQSPTLIILTTFILLGPLLLYMELRLPQSQVTD